MSQEGDLRIGAVYFSPDGRHVATAAQDQLVRVRLFFLFSAPSLVRLTCNAWAKIWVISQRNICPTFVRQALEFSHDVSFLTSGSNDRTARIWDSSLGIGAKDQGLGTEYGSCEGKESRRQHVVDCAGHRDHIFSISLPQDGPWVASGSLDGSVRFWDKHGRAQFAISGHKNTGT